MKAENMKQPCGAICCALLLSLSGCATNSPTQAACLPPLPDAPRPKLSLSTPLPPQTYSISAGQKLSAWRQHLMGTQLMRDYSTNLSNPKEKP